MCTHATLLNFTSSINCLDLYKTAIDPPFQEKEVDQSANLDQNLLYLSNRFPLYILSYIKWTVVCKTTGREKAGLPH